jgi:pimeloyl-ACP methyl ester carboxylesterase
MSRSAVEGWVRAADGVRIAYRDHGGSARGRSLVLLHGGGANLESMDQYADRLGRTRRRVAIDVRCCGRSDDAPRFRLTDAAADVAAVVEQLELGPVDVVGHSMGGFVGGFYGTATPSARVVSIDGFGPGMVTVGSEADRAEFRAFQDGMREAFFAMTAPPETGDAEWRGQQVELLCDLFPKIGYTAPNARVMAERNFVELTDGVYHRRPPRHLFADAFADDGDADILRMYRHTVAPTLIIRCTESGAPPVLDHELDALAAANDAVRVVRLPLTHLAPAWDAIDEVVDAIGRFLDD